MSVYKTPKSRYFQYDFVRKGVRFHGSTGVETRRAAEAVERRLRNQAATGELGSAALLTLDDAAGRWWDEVGRHKRSAVQLEHRLAIALRLLGPKTPLNEVTTARIAKAVEKRRGEGYTRAKPKKDFTPRRYELSNATVNADVIKPVQRILNRARRTWEIKGLPEIDWEALLLTPAPTEIRIYTEAHQSAWLDASDPTSRFALRLLLTYGMRFSELFFDPRDFKPPSREMGAHLVMNHRKVGSHLLPLRADDAAEIAARVGRAIAAGLPTIWIEQTLRGKLATVRYGALQSRLYKSAKAAGISDRRVIHGTRHHIGTTILNATGNLRLTQKLLGHADIKSTTVYAHALDEGLRAALESRNSPGAPDPETEFVVPPQVSKRRSR